jgi:hypothetical protein
MSRTFNKDHVGRPAWRVSLLGALLALVLVPAALSAQSVDDKYRQNRDRNSRFNLNASATTVLRVNQYQCGLSNDGDTCTDVFDSPTGGGGFWPTGSPNQYMFNAGLQITASSRWPTTARTRTPAAWSAASRGPVTRRAPSWSALRARPSTALRSATSTTR